MRGCSSILPYFILLLLMVTPVFATDWSEWQYKIPIAIIERSGQDLHNYPVRVELNSSNFDFNLAKPDGSDIRFSDEEGNPLGYYIEEWNSTAQHAKILVKVPFIPAGSGTTIYMYCGNPSATSESNFLSVLNVLVQNTETPVTISGPFSTGRVFYIAMAFSTNTSRAATIKLSDGGFNTEAAFYVKEDSASFYHYSSSDNAWQLVLEPPFLKVGEIYTLKFYVLNNASWKLCFENESICSNLHDPNKADTSFDFLAITDDDSVPENISYVAAHQFVNPEPVVYVNKTFHAVTIYSKEGVTGALLCLYSLADGSKVACSKDNLMYKKIDPTDGTSSTYTLPYKVYWSKIHIKAPGTNNELKLQVIKPDGEVELYAATLSTSEKTYYVVGDGEKVYALAEDGSVLNSITVPSPFKLKVYVKDGDTSSGTDVYAEVYYPPTTLSFETNVTEYIAKKDKELFGSYQPFYDTYITAGDKTLLLVQPPTDTVSVIVLDMNKQPLADVDIKISAYLDTGGLATVLHTKTDAAGSAPSVRLPENSRFVVLLKYNGATAGPYIFWAKEGETYQVIFQPQVVDFQPLKLPFDGVYVSFSPEKGKALFFGENVTFNITIIDVEEKLNYSQICLDAPAWNISECVNSSSPAGVSLIKTVELYELNQSLPYVEITVRLDRVEGTETYSYTERVRYYVYFRTSIFDMKDYIKESPALLFLIDGGVIVAAFSAGGLFGAALAAVFLTTLGIFPKVITIMLIILLVARLLGVIP